MEQEKQNNGEIENKLADSERQAAKFRLDYQKAEQARTELRDEVS